MNHNIFRKAAVAATILLSLPNIFAQNTLSGYFLDEYTYRFQMNPAIGNDKNFVGMPGLSNINVAMGGNLHLTDVIYNIDGHTTTFLNPGVSASKLMSNLGENNRTGVSTRIDILSTGFKAWGGYNTIAISARADAMARIPNSLFSLLKEGVKNREYNITNLGVRATMFAEIAFGHSRQINNNLRIGGAFKFIVGGGNIDARFHDARLVLYENDWGVASDAEIKSNVKGLTYNHDVNSRTGHEYVSGAEINNPGPNGFGAAIDFGVVYKVSSVEGLTLSASLLDLGVISWSNTMLASTGGQHYFNTDKYTFNVDDSAPNSFKSEWNRLRDDFSAIYELNDMGNTGSSASMLAATMNLAGEYEFPLYRKLKFGLLNSTRFCGPYTQTEFRLSANVAPSRLFSASASIAEGTNGFSFGWLLNLHATGYNMFLGMDHTTFKLAKQGVPLSCNAQVNLGINFLF